MAGAGRAGRGGERRQLLLRALWVWLGRRACRRHCCGARSRFEGRHGLRAVLSWHGLSCGVGTGLQPGTATLASRTSNAGVAPRHWCTTQPTAMASALPGPCQGHRPSANGCRPHTGFGGVNALPRRRRRATAAAAATGAEEAAGEEELIAAAESQTAASLAAAEVRHIGAGLLQQSGRVRWPTC